MLTIIFCRNYLFVFLCAAHVLAVDTSTATAAELRWQLNQEDLTAQQFQTVGRSLKLDVSGPLHWSGAGRDRVLYLGDEITRLTATTAQARGLLPTDRLGVEAIVWLEEAPDWGAIVGYFQDNGGLEKGWLLGNRGRRFCFGLSTVGANEQDADKDGRLTYLTSQSEFRLRTWYHVLATYDGAQMRLYVNGELQAEDGNQSGDILYPEDAVLSVAAYADADEFYPLRGMLAEVAVMSGAPPAADIPQRATSVQQRIADLPNAAPRRIAPKLGPIIRVVERTTADVRWLPDETDRLTLVANEARVVAAESVRDGALEANGEPHPWRRALITQLEPPGEYGFALQPTRSVDGIGTQYRFDSSHAYLRPPFPSAASSYPDDSKIDQAVQQVLQLGGWRAGFALVLGADGEHFAYELARKSRLQVTIVEPDPVRANKARTRLAAAGAYGTHVTVHVADFQQLPYSDYSANLVVVSGVWDGTPLEVTPEEIHRVLRPFGGAAFWQAAHMSSPDFRGELPGAGEWTHQYGRADNASCSRDELVQGGTVVQWWGPPGPRPMPDRGGRNPSPLSVAGYLFTQGDRVIYGQDAYNGTIYWMLMAPGLRRSNVPRDCSNYAAAADALYVALGTSCLAIEPRTGAILNIFDALPAAHGDDVDWGYVGYVDETLVGTTVQRGAAYIADDGEWYEDYAANQIAKVVSPLLFARNRHSGELEWQYTEAAVINSTITMDAESVYFVATRNPAVLESIAARHDTKQLSEGQILVALDRQTGKVRWERTSSLDVCDYMTYMAVAGGKLIISGTDQAKTFHHFGFDAATGAPIWDRHDSTSKTHHSGHLDHMVVIGDKIYSNQHIMDLSNGRDVGELYAERRGCGIMAGSNHMLFFRDHFHSMWDLESGKRWEFPGIRSGCWLGIVPAGGLVLAPESSSGCSCTHAVQTSVGFRPIPPQSD